MSYDAAAIRTAIKNVLEGTIGSVRTMDTGQMLSGVFEGQAPQARKAKTLHSAEHRFDVRIGAVRQHEASPVAAIGSYSLKRADIFVDVTTKTATQVQIDARDDVLANVLADVEQAAQALSYPRNVEQTSALAATGIVSGLLLGPGGEGVPVCEEPQQDWERQEIKTRISASCVLRVRQSVVDDDRPITIFGSALRGWWRADVMSESAQLLTHWPDISERAGAVTITPPVAPSQTLTVDFTTSLGQTSVQSLGQPFNGYRVAGSGELLDAAAPPNLFIVGGFTTVDTGVTSRIIDATDGANVVCRAFKDASDNIAYQVDTTTVSTITPADTARHLFAFLHDGTDALVRLDDEGVTGGTAAPSASAAVDIGVPSTSSSDCAAFEYFEIVLLDSYPTPEQQSAYRQYVVDRYGLSITP